MSIDDLWSSLRPHRSISELLVSSQVASVFTVVDPLASTVTKHLREAMIRKAAIVVWPFPVHAPGFTALTRRSSTGARAEALRLLERTVLPGNWGIYPTVRNWQGTVSIDKPTEALSGVTDLGRLRAQSELVDLRERVATDTAFDIPQRTHRLERVISSGDGVLVKTTRSRKYQLWWRFLSLVPKAFGHDSYALRLPEAMMKIRQVYYPIRLGLRKRLLPSQQDLASITMAVPIFQETSMMEAVGVATNAGFRVLNPRGMIPAEIYKLFLPGNFELAPGYFAVNRAEEEVLVRSVTRGLGRALLPGNIFMGWRKQDDFPALLDLRQAWHAGHFGTEDSGKTSLGNVRLTLTSDAYVVVTAAYDQRASTLRIVHEHGGIIKRIGPGVTEEDGESFVAQALGYLRSGKPVAVKPDGPGDRPHLVLFLAGFLPRLVKTLTQEGLVVPDNTVISFFIDDWYGFKNVRYTHPELRSKVDVLLAVLELICSMAAKPRLGPDEPHPFPGMSLIVTTQAIGDLPQEVIDKMGAKVFHHNHDRAKMVVGGREVQLSTRVSNPGLHDRLMRRAPFAMLEGLKKEVQ